MEMEELPSLASSVRFSRRDSMQSSLGSSRSGVDDEEDDLNDGRQRFTVSVDDGLVESELCILLRDLQMPPRGPSYTNIVIHSHHGLNANGSPSSSTTATPQPSPMTDTPYQGDGNKSQSSYAFTPSQTAQTYSFTAAPEQLARVEYFIAKYAVALLVRREKPSKKDTLNIGDRPNRGLSESSSSPASSPMVHGYDFKGDLDLRSVSTLAAEKPSSPRTFPPLLSSPSPLFYLFFFSPLNFQCVQISVYLIPGRRGHVIHSYLHLPCLQPTPHSHLYPPPNISFTLEKIRFVSSSSVSEAAEDEHARQQALASTASAPDVAAELGLEVLFASLHSSFHLLPFLSSFSFPSMSRFCADQWAFLLKSYSADSSNWQTGESPPPPKARLLF